MESKAVLDIKNLTIRFHESLEGDNVVDDVSFELLPGKTLAIVGESGSGKSVTALSLTKLLPEKATIISSKGISYNGKDIAQLSEEEMRPYRGGKVAYIFQEPMSSLNPSLSCGFQVDEMLQLHTKLSSSERKQKVLDVFGEVLLDEPSRVYDAFPHQLSGGQLQRVMIAMAISCAPKVLIADEPTTALDVTVQRQIIDVLQSLQQKSGMALIFISHDLGVVKEIADNVIVMQKGVIVEKGSVAQIFERPSHPYTAGLIASRPSMEYRLSKLPTVDDYLKFGTVYDFDKYKIDNHTYTQRQEYIQKQDIVLELIDIQKDYFSATGFWKRKKKRTRVLEGVNLKIRKGETLGLVGESGCGKSTLANIIMGIIPQTEGKVLYQGKDINHLIETNEKQYRKEVQIIFQDPYASLNPRMTVGAAIMEPMRIHGIGDATIRRQKAIRLLEDVGLDRSHLDRYPHQFSGGQRQRINIARALAVEPSLIICDESVSALDVSVQAQVLNMLQKLKESYGLTYIFISHDISVIHHISDRVAVMHKGRIVEYNDVSSVIHNPSSPYTKTLLDAVMM